MQRRICRKYTFAGKEAEADASRKEFMAPIATHTASEDFDAYSAYTYLDNGLRRVPNRLGNNHVFISIPASMGIWSGTTTLLMCVSGIYFRETAISGRCPEPPFGCLFQSVCRDANIKKFFSLVQPGRLQSVGYREEPVSSGKSCCGGAF